MEVPIEMDDLRGYPYFRKPPVIGGLVDFPANHVRSPEVFFPPIKAQNGLSQRHGALGRSPHPRRMQGTTHLDGEMGKIWETCWKNDSKIMEHEGNMLDNDDEGIEMRA